MLVNFFVASVIIVSPIAIIISNLVIINYNDIIIMACSQNVLVYIISLFWPEVKV